MLGSEFSMAAEMGARYRVTNRVVEFPAKAQRGIDGTLRRLAGRFG